MTLTEVSYVPCQKPVATIFSQNLSTVLVAEPWLFLFPMLPNTILSNLYCLIGLAVTPTATKYTFAKLLS